MHRRLTRPTLVVGLQERPRHKVPRLAAAGDEPRLRHGTFGTERRVEVAAQVVNGCNRFLRLAHAVHPVAGNHARRFQFMHRLGVACYVFGKQITVERQPFVPVRIAPLHGNLSDAGTLREQRLAGVAPVRGARPVLAIYPHAVNVIFTHHLEQLRNEQFLIVSSQPAGVVRVRIAPLVDARPLGMQFDGAGVPHTGIMNRKRDTHVAGNFAPDLQRIVHNARRRRADLRGIARITGMPLAVVLHKIRLHLFQHGADMLVSGVLAQVGVPRTGMQVIMQPKKSVFMPVFSSHNGGSHSQRHRQDKRK